MAVRGSNQSGMRQFNERIVLQAIRLHGATAKADLARLTQLSTQTVAIIVERLLGDGLLLKLEPVRGRVGQPSVPLALNPEGAYSLGLQVGRRSLETLCCDFLGRVTDHHVFRYEHPDPQKVLPQIRQALARVRKTRASSWKKVVGVGLTAPLSLHKWADVLGGEAGRALARWESVDLSQELAALTDLPVVFAKDTTSACVAELLQGHGQQLRSFLHVFVGTFIGGGLVLSGHIVNGERGNAGAIGSMPVGLSGLGAPPQLLELASGWQLEKSLIGAGLNGMLVHEDSIMDSAYAGYTGPWLAQASRSLAMGVASAASLLDLDGVVVDGSLGRSLINALIAQTREALRLVRFDGMNEPQLLAGKVGAHARALGAALLPLHTQFFPDKDIFLKQDPVVARGLNG